MRETPTWRIPIGIIGLCIALVFYGLAIANWIGPLVTPLHALVQLPIYIFLGVVWILPLRGFLSWMETGRWR